MDRSRTLSDATSRGRPGADAASVHSSEGSVSEVPSPTSPTPHLEQGKKKKSFVKSLFSRLKSKKSDKNVTRTQDDLVEVDDVVEDDQEQGVRGRAYTTGAVDRTRALQAAPVRPSPPRETASTSTATLTTAAAERSTSRSTSRHHSHSRSDSPRDSSEQDASDHPIPHDLTEPAEEEGFNEQEDTRPSPRPRRTEIDMAAILATTRELDRSKSLSMASFCLLCAALPPQHYPPCLNPFFDIQSGTNCSFSPSVTLLESRPSRSEWRPTGCRTESSQISHRWRRLPTTSSKSAVAECHF
eukprot:m.812806 g.812806  ORF g.812806 m.812806 type:complete len:299 (-) comp59348_c0_seq7:2863-3759(-)